MKKPMKASKGDKNHLCLVPVKDIEHDDITLINPKKLPLSPAFLKTFEGFEEISDEESESICKSSLLIAQMLLEFHAYKNTIPIDNQHVVHSRAQNETSVINLEASYKNKAA